jgi:hypothetical protein
VGSLSVLATVDVEAFVVGQVDDSVSSVGPFLPPVSSTGAGNGKLLSGTISVGVP